MAGKDLRIIYMGTPDFAVAPLRALVEGGYNIVAVVTMPDKPAGRGLKLQQSPVKQYACSVGLPVLQPIKLKDPDFVDRFNSLNADLGIVVAFRMLPRIIWEAPRLGTFNLHASLLPQYRGAAPINWAIINGEQKTGITTFFLNEKIDEGEIIDAREVVIEPSDNAGSLHDKLMNEGTSLVLDTVDRIGEGSYNTKRQNNIPAEQLKTAPKIFKDTCHVDFSRPGAEVVNLIRGLSPYPAAWAYLFFADHNADPVAVKIFEAHFEPHDKYSEPHKDLESHDKFSEPHKECSESHDKLSKPHEGYSELHQDHSQPRKGPECLEIGTVLSDGKYFLKVVCADGVIDIIELQMAGKRRMAVQEFLRGFKDIKGLRFN